MIDLTKAKEAAMFAHTFTCDPEHDYFIGAEVPKGEAWELTTMWMRMGKGGLNEAMIGVVKDDTFVALASRRRPLDGDALSWSGQVLMTEEMRILYWAEGAVQEEEIACSATWKVLAGPEAPVVVEPGDHGSKPPGEPKPKPKAKPKPKEKAQDEPAADSDR